MTDQEIKDGGPAFPNVPSDPQIMSWDAGMSLRDWFAGQAISPMLVQAYGQTPDILARKAFEIADAMIKERRKGDNEPQ